MPNLALITGASGGIGLALAHEHCRRGGDAVLVARNKQALEAARKELESAYGVSVLVKSMDLTQPEAGRRLVDWVEKEGLVVEILINNAGVGGHGKFVSRSVDDDLAMLQLNMLTLTTLMHRFLPQMVARGSGRVLNVGSTAGFLPGPNQAVYYATKAYVNSLSQAVNEELRDTGVTVTVLCPGPVKTNFEAAAGMPELRVFKGAISAEKTAKAGYRAMEKGTDVVIVPKSMAAALRSASLLPRRMVTRVSGKTMEK